MKKLFILIFLNTVFSLTGQTKDIYRKITKATAKSIKTFNENDICSMVTYYYASCIRKDDKWKLVLQDPKYWSDRMKDSIKNIIYRNL